MDMMKTKIVNHMKQLMDLERKIVGNEILNDKNRIEAIRVWQQKIWDELFKDIRIEVGKAGAIKSLTDRLEEKRIELANKLEHERKRTYGDVEYKCRELHDQIKDIDTALYQIKCVLVEEGVI
jgi:hypothetical protein